MATEIRYISSEVTEDEKLNVTAKMQLQVQFDVTDTVANRKGPPDALGLAGLPQIGDGYRYNSSRMDLVYCNRRTAKQRGIEHYHLFDVDLDFKSFVSEGGFDINPLSMPPKYSYPSELFQSVLEKDLNDVYIRNPAGDFYSEPVMVDDSRPDIRVTRNEPTAPDTIMETYQNAMNSTTVTINNRTYAAKTLKIKSITAGDPQIWGGSIQYYTVVYDLQLRREGWEIKLLAKGSRSFDEGNGVTPEPIKDERGCVIPGESFLDASGLKISSSGTPYTQTFVGYKSLNFRTLGL